MLNNLNIYMMFICVFLAVSMIMYHILFSKFIKFIWVIIVASFYMFKKVNVYTILMCVFIAFRINKLSSGIIEIIQLNE